ncbi:hypothetical protein JKY79_00145 [Candidatus Babeliales bacterium]|nr:hypothetical protein [Candidatus Babeliales bacterium]
MVIEAELNKLIAARVHRILDYGELAVASDKYQRFRTLVLDEFGQSGLRREIAELLARGGQSGK